MKSFSTALLLLAFIALLEFTAPGAMAQAVSNVQGTIDTVMMDDGYIVIDGKQLVVRAADLVITYKGEPVRASFLDSGLSVFYSTRSDGSVSEITLIGPASVLDALGQQ